MTLAVTMSLCFVHFPMWGSMFLPGNPEYEEEDYYIQEFTADEIARVRLKTVLAIKHVPYFFLNLIHMAHGRIRLLIEHCPEIQQYIDPKQLQSSGTP